MIRVPRSGTYVLVTIACLGEIGCQVQLRRPNTTPTRMIEPQVLEPQQSLPAPQVKKAADATPIRLLDTQALGHIGRPLLHQQANGELTEDGVWRWSSAPDRYLDTALRLAIESNPNLRLVDTQPRSRTRRHATGMGVRGEGGHEARRICGISSDRDRPRGPHESRAN